ncbi:hypothetical protein V8E53_002606 [Lactarius tabidus]
MTVDPYIVCGNYFIQCTYPFISVETFKYVSNKVLTPRPMNISEEVYEVYLSYRRAAIGLCPLLQGQMDCGDMDMDKIGTGMKLLSEPSVDITISDLKLGCGFNNNLLDQMLIPIQYLNAYNKDHVGIRAQCLHAIFLGPSKAINGLGLNQRANQTSIAELLSVVKITVPIIVYTAILLKEMLHWWTNFLAKAKAQARNHQAEKASSKEDPFGEPSDNEEMANNRRLPDPKSRHEDVDSTTCNHSTITAVAQMRGGGGWKHSPQNEEQDEPVPSPPAKKLKPKACQVQA